MQSKDLKSEQNQIRKGGQAWGINIGELGDMDDAQKTMPNRGAQNRKEQLQVELELKSKLNQY